MIKSSNQSQFKSAPTSADVDIFICMWTYELGNSKLWLKLFFFYCQTHDCLGASLNFLSVDASNLPVWCLFHTWHYIYFSVIVVSCSVLFIKQCVFVYVWMFLYRYTKANNFLVNALKCWGDLHNFTTDKFIMNVYCLFMQVLYLLYFLLLALSEFWWRLQNTD